MPRLPITQTFARMQPMSPAEAALVASGGCGCENNHLQPESAFAVANVDPTPTEATWSGIIGTEGLLTGDGRLIESNALEWAELPIPLRYVSQDVGAHDGAQVVGRILSITRLPNGDIAASGDFDLGSEVGREAHRVVEAEIQNGVSMDLDSVSFEVRVAKELLEGAPDAALLEVEETPVADAEGRVTVATIEADEEVMVTTSARIRAATLVAVPAFASAKIEVDTKKKKDDDEEDPEAPADGEEEEPPAEEPVDEGQKDDDEDDDDDEEEEVKKKVTVKAAAKVTALRASGFPAAPPAEWFTDPHLEGPTPLTVTQDGRVYGHLAVWGTCHTAYPGQCVTPPSSMSSYGYFRTGSVLTAEGTEVAVGHITLDTLHADQKLSANATAVHYEKTGKSAAYVAAGEDEFGIWLSGAVRPDLSAAQVRELRASPLSGDWRRIGNNLELVGALAVNVPGFPIPRPKGLVASGVMTSLVASGMVPPSQVRAPGQPGALTSDDLRYLKRLAAHQRKSEADKLASKVFALKAEALAARLRKA